MEDNRQLISDADLIRLFEDMKNNTGNQKWIVNPKEISKFICAYKLIKDVFAGNDVKIELNLYEPFEDYGSIVVIGKNITISNIDVIAQVINESLSFECFPRTDGTVALIFGFSELSTPLREVM